jgi:hypothetical protein
MKLAQRRNHINNNPGTIKGNNVEKKMILTASVLKKIHGRDSDTDASSTSI